MSCIKKVFFSTLTNVYYMAKHELQVAASATCHVPAEPILVKLAICVCVWSIFKRAKCHHNFTTLFQTFNKIGPDSLIFFNDFFFRALDWPKKSET